MHESKHGNMEFERRVFPRFVMHLPFAYTLESREGTESQGITGNISRGGLLVYLPERVTTGDVLQLTLSLPEGQAAKTIQAAARVAWVQKSMLPPPKSYKAGVEFTQISDQALEFLHWFEQLWLNQAG